MTHDVVIRNGLIVDGLKNSAYPGDVAIDGDTISALGKVDTEGRREINAEGAVVTPPATPMKQIHPNAEA